MLSKLEEAELKRLEANDTLIIVVGQTDDTHYLVLCVNETDYRVERLTAPQIVLYTPCHLSSDCGMWDVRQLFEWGTYADIFKKYPQETILTVSDFMGGKHPNITDWMTQKQFKATVYELSAVVDSHMGMTPLKAFKKRIRKMVEEVKSHRKLPKDYGLTDKGLHDLAKKFIDDGKNKE